MTANLRLRRSALYMPAINARALEKARQLPCDCIIVDLEDGVAPARKHEAREVFARALAEGGYGQREVIIRCNSLRSEWGHDDLAFVATLPVDGVLLTKVDEAEDVRQAAALLIDAGSLPDMPLWVMAETPRGILNLPTIAASHPSLACIVLGTNDLVYEMRARHVAGRWPLLPIFTQAVLAARAQGLDVLDGVHLDIDDAVGLRAACQQARDMGFDGKTLIHPSQLMITNEVFSPTMAEVAEARSIQAAYAAAVQAGRGVATLNGRFIENLHAYEAQRLLQMAALIEQGRT